MTIQLLLRGGRVPITRALVLFLPLAMLTAGSSLFAQRVGVHVGKGYGASAGSMGAAGASVSGSAGSRPGSSLRLGLDGYGSPLKEYLPNVWAEADRGVADYIASLADRPFRRGDFRILSLVTNSTTNRKIAERLNDVHVPFDFASRDALGASLRRHRGKQLFVVGHVEDDAFRVYDAAHAEKFSIGVSELIYLAKKCCGIVVIPIGCNVAEVSGGGTADAFKSGYAVDRLILAFDRAETQAEFFQTFASPEIRLVIGSWMLPGTGRREIMIFQVIYAQDGPGPGGGLPPRVVPSYGDSAVTGRILQGRIVGSMAALGPTGGGRHPVLIGTVAMVLLGWIAISWLRTK